jgi:hypothetical protein
MTVLARVIAVAALLIPPFARAQEKIPITEKVVLVVSALPEESATPELKKEYDELAKALDAELKAQAASFNAECRWNIVIRVGIRPKSKVLEISLEPPSPLSPRLFTTVFLRRASFENDAAFNEAVKGLVKTIVTRTATCT